jgi:hypothetical protein
MLHYEVVDNPTLELLRKLLIMPGFEPLRLVGGTALALHYGHRKSIDIDLFGALNVDDLSIVSAVQEVGNTTLLQNHPSIKSFSVDSIKVDIVRYPYPWLDDVHLEDGLRLAGVRDIAAMKLAAVTGRGTKKDFVDVYFLLKQFTLSQMISWYTRKFPDATPFMVVKSLVYFDDADQDPEPVRMIPVEWEEIKRVMVRVQTEYLNSL